MSEENEYFSPYCTICGACGEDGCCPATVCKQAGGDYCDFYLQELKLAYLVLDDLLRQDPMLVDKYLELREKHERLPLANQRYEELPADRYAERITARNSGMEND